MATDYDVIQQDDLNTFLAEVQGALDAGWQLAGGVSVWVSGRTAFYTQALVKGTPAPVGSSLLDQLGVR
jgi:hypothetical protein